MTDLPFRHSPTGDRHMRIRHSAASLLSAAGLPIEQISDVLGHEGPRTTAAVYRHLVNPSVSAGKAPMDAMFSGSRDV